MMNTLASLYQRYGATLGLLCIIFIPIKLSFTYCVLIPLLILYIAATSKALISHSNTLQNLYFPFVIFIATAAVSSLFGLDPLNSIRKLAELGFFSISILLFFDVTKQVQAEKVLLCLFFGHLISGSYALVRAAYQHQIPEVFIGPVTQSGQLACSFLLAIGLLVHCWKKNKVQPLKLKHLGMVLICLMLYLGIAFGNLDSFSFVVFLVGALAFLLLGIQKLIYTLRKDHIDYRQYFELLLTLITPLLLASLLANLKRGPWLGVGIATVIFLLLTSRLIYTAIPILIAAASLLIQPVYERIIQSSADFFIVGGRHLLWEIGLELSSRFPLGVGYENSSIVKSFSTNIPPQLEHFHNNFLNLLVETGYLGLGLFVWWLILIIKAVFTKTTYKQEPLAVGIVCGLIAWQLAGIVEYNIGDSEVILLIFLVIGVLAKLLSDQETNKVSN